LSKAADSGSNRQWFKQNLVQSDFGSNRLWFKQTGEGCCRGSYVCGNEGKQLLKRGGWVVSIVEVVRNDWLY